MSSNRKLSCLEGFGFGRCIRVTTDLKASNSADLKHQTLENPPCGQEGFQTSIFLQLVLCLVILRFCSGRPYLMSCMLTCFHPASSDI